MTAVAFDTLAYAKRLQEAGMEPRLAEAQALALAEALAGSIAELATKHDIADLKRDLKELEAATKSDIQALELTLRRDMTDLQASLIRWMAGFMFAGLALASGIGFGLARLLA